MVTIESNVDKVAGALQEVPALITEEIIKGVHEYLFTLRNQARRSHRYTRRTGTLERSVSSSKQKEGGSVFIEDAQCDYGKYVHRGHRSWAPDEFIFNAYDKTEKMLDDRIDKSIDSALKKAGF